MSLSSQTIKTWWGVETLQGYCEEVDVEKSKIEKCCLIIDVSEVLLKRSSLP